MKRKLSMVIALVLCVVMVVAMFAGCAGDTQDSSKPEESKSEASKADDSSKEDEQPKEMVTLDVILNLGSGLQEGLWWTDYLLEKTGCKLNIINGNDTDIATYIAADNLPDAFHIAGQTTTLENMKAIVAAGQAINYDEYKDSIPNVYSAINETALKYSRDTFGGGTNLYYLPGASSETDSDFGGTEYGMRINLAYFEEYIAENGYPELKTLDDFIPVLKWMQDKHPTTEDGQPAYGMSMFTDWDGNFIAHSSGFMQQLGYYPSVWPMIVKCDDMSTSYAFDDNSIYYQVLKFFFHAQQAGILDPDTLTQTWDDFVAKNNADRVYSGYCWSISTECKLVMYDDYHPVSYSGAWILGNWNGSAGIGVSSKSKNIDRVLDVMNFACDYDNVWYCLFGPQGEYWDLNDDGVPYITDFGYEMADDETVVFAEGGNIADAPNFNLRLLNYLQTKHPVYGVTADPGSWPVADDKKTDVQKNWEAFCKEQYNVDLGDVTLSEVGLLNALDRFSVYRAEFSDSTRSEEMNDILTRATSFVPDSCWKMVYAKDEAEFDALWKQLQSDVEAINMRSVYDYECEKLANGEIFYID